MPPFLHSTDLAKLSVLITYLDVKTSCTRAPHVIGDSTSVTFTVSHNKVQRSGRAQHQVNEDPCSSKREMLFVSVTTSSSVWPQCREHVFAWPIKKIVENSMRWKKEEEETVATETSCFPLSFWACSRSVWAWPQREGEINSAGVVQQRNEARKIKSGLLMRAFGWVTLTATGESRRLLSFHY